VCQLDVKPVERFEGRQWPQPRFVAVTQHRELHLRRPARYRLPALSEGAKLPGDRVERCLVGAARSEVQVCELHHRLEVGRRTDTVQFFAGRVDAWQHLHKLAGQDLAKLRCPEFADAAIGDDRRDDGGLAGDVIVGH